MAARRKRRGLPKRGSDGKFLSFRGTRKKRGRRHRRRRKRGRGRGRRRGRNRGRRSKRHLHKGKTLMEIIKCGN